MKNGIDVLLEDASLQKKLQGRRVALLAHPASMTKKSFLHSIDALKQLKGLQLVSAFGPQHGMRGEKQDNMVETDDFVDPIHKIPVFSLYGQVRKPTKEMIDTFDVLLVDLQDVGTRIYTFVTTLLYVMEAGAREGKEVWVLDRPNPAGRPVEGSILKPGWESFVGAGPMPMRHGLTMAELALWYKKHFKLDLTLQIVKMEGYAPDKGPGFGWPIGELPWVNPSPNAATLGMARAFPGTVMLEGTHLSEGRGTTHPLEVMGAPDLDMRAVYAEMLRLAPDWTKGCRARLCFFQPTFHKHAGKMCEAIQLHVDDETYQHEVFQPYRFVTLWFKAIRRLYPSYEIWRDFPYEYETTRLAIDLINGGPGMREWVDDKASQPGDFDKLVKSDERLWLDLRKEFLLY